MINYYVKKNKEYHNLQNKRKGDYYIVTKIDQTSIYFNDDYYFFTRDSNYYIWKFFYTSQEVRKLKLKQLMT